jgi:excisionase family DNA binding protein
MNDLSEPAGTLSITEAAARLGVNHQTLYRAIRAGTTSVPSVRIGRSVRIPAAPIETFLATGCWPTLQESA